MESTTPTIPESLQTGVCPNCGYSLSGLPGVGVCPECGGTYDGNEVVVYGYARGRHANIGNTTPSIALRIVALWIAIIALQSPRFRIDPFSWLIVALLLPQGIYQFFRRKQVTHPGLIQVRIGERGCVQYDDLGGPSVFRDLFWAYGWIFYAAAAIVLALCVREGRIDLSRAGIWIVFLVIFAAIAWVRGVRFRRAMREVREGAIADFNSAYRPLALWKHIKVHSVKPIRSGTYRLKIDTFTKFSRNDVVDAEIRCSEEQAMSLGRLIDGHIRYGHAEIGMRDMSGPIAEQFKSARMTEQELADRLEREDHESRGVPYEH